MALNLGTLVVSTIGFYLFGLILRQLKVEPVWLGVLALAFTPVVYINSVSAMDYLWGLTLILFGFYSLLKSNSLAAGAFLGLAAGCRLTSVTMLLPFSLWILLQPRPINRPKEIALLLISTIAVTILCFLPVIQIYGLDFLRVSIGDYPEWTGVLRRGTTGVWGRLGLIGLMIGIVWAGAAWVRGNSPTRESRNLAVLPVSLIVVLLYGTLYLAMPHESGYLIPAIPFVILLFGKILPKEGFRTVCILLALSPFFYIDVKYSPIERHHHRRVEQMDYASEMVDRAMAIGPNNVLVTGGNWRPVMESLSMEREGEAPVFLSTPDLETLDGFLGQGFSIYYLTEMGDFLKNTMGERFSKVSPIEISSERMQPIDSPSFRGVLLDNTANRNRQGAGFNPLVWKPFPHSNLYRNDSVGINFEHIFNGAKAQHDLSMFTPRKDPCELKKIGEDYFELAWPSEGSSWGMEARMVYDLSKENQVDLIFECTPTADLYPQGFAAMMWASYMKCALDRRIHFWGEEENRTGWVAWGEGEGKEIEVGTVSHAGVPDLPYEEGAQTLNLIEDPEKKFIAPFYYGLLDGDQNLETTDDKILYLVLFDQTDPIRFAMWNFFRNESGEPDTHSPAWDWQYAIRDPEMGKKYGYRARIVVKQFEGEEQIWEEYRRWGEDLGVELPVVDEGDSEFVK
ncbi:MAG: hypothetical protein H6752_10475 [Candidatus Omnitrophica bacterium]|nr:hypothetical protein [Candidatus Omnitrophota bacterium]